VTKAHAQLFLNYPLRRWPALRLLLLLIPHFGWAETLPSEPTYPIHVDAANQVAVRSIAKDPDWVWQMRATEFFWTIEMTEPELKHRLQVVKKLGYNTVVNCGYHYRFSVVNRWDDIAKQVALITRLAHEEGLRLIEHHSALATTESDLDTQWKGVPLRELRNLNAQTGTHDCFSGKSLFLCPNNPGYQDAYLSHLKALCEAGVDGIMADDVEFCLNPYDCSCEHCRKEFKLRSGIELPSVDDKTFWMNWDSPGFRQWIRFRQESVGRHYARIKDLMRSINPDSKLMACQSEPTGLCLNVQWGLAIEEVAKSADVLFLEAQNYAGYFTDWPRQASDMMFLRGLGRQGQKPVFALTYLSGRKTYELLFGSQEAAKAFRPAGIVGYEGVLTGKAENAHGLDEQYFTWALNMMYGNRYWMIMGEENDLQTHAFEERAAGIAFQKPESVANVAIFYSRQTRDFTADTVSAAHLAEWRGWCMAALTANVPYDVVFDDDLTRGGLNKYALLVLPNAVCLNRRQTENIAEYVRNGGHLVAAGETSTRDENANPLDELRLAQVLGVSRKGVWRAVKGPDVTIGAAALPATSAADVLQCAVVSGAEVTGEIPMTLRGTPAGSVKYIHHLGQGVSMFIPIPVGLWGGLKSPQRIEQKEKQYPYNDVRWKGSDAPQLQDLMRDALRWGAAESLPFMIESPPGVMATFQKVQGKYVVQLLNATGALHKPGDTYDPNQASFPPVAKSISIRFGTLRAAHARYLAPGLDAETPLEVQEKDGKSSIDIPAAFAKYGVVVFESANPATEASVVTPVTQRPHPEWPYNDLFLLQPAEGQPAKKVVTKEDWAKKREQLKRSILSVFGPFPETKCPLNPAIIREEKHGNTILRIVEFDVEPGDRIQAVLTFPAGLKPGERLPVILALHGTNGGLGGISCWTLEGYPSMEIARILPEKGYIVLAPDGITFGKHLVEPGDPTTNTDSFYKKHPQWSILGKLVYDATRSIDYVETLDMADTKRIAAIGHSLGGYWAQFTAAFDDRVAVAVSSCGFTPFRGDTNPGGSDNAPCRWARYTGFNHAPALARYWEKNIQPPFDFHEVMALIAPRPFLNVSGNRDACWPDVEAIQECCRAAEPAYQFFDVPERFHCHIYEGPHDHFESEAIYGWLDRWLKH
jgi:dienelactone hydrolase